MAVHTLNDIIETLLGQSLLITNITNILSQVALVARATPEPATPSSPPGTLPRPKIWCLFSPRLSRWSTRSCRSSSLSEEAVEEEAEVEVGDAVVEDVMEVVGEVEDGECVCVKL